MLVFELGLSIFWSHQGITTYLSLPKFPWPEKIDGPPSTLTLCLSD